MPAMTKNATVSQAVLWSSCLISLAGLYLDSTKTLSLIGQTLFWSGMIQSLYGTVFEIEKSKRTWYFCLGVPICVASVYVAYMILRDSSLSSHGIIAVVFTALLLQCLITAISTKIWDLRHHTSDAT